MPLCPQITNTPTVLPREVAISAVTYTSTTATYTASGHSFIAGDVVVITGLAPAGYNGTFTIASVSGSTTFTVSNSTNTTVTDQVGLATPGGVYVIGSVLPVVAATTTQVNAAQANANAAAAAAAAAAAIAATAVQVSANTIVNASNQLTAINGTGITVYSGASSTSGARVVLNSLGLAGYNTGGSATFAISASTGTVEVTGGILSGGSITGTQINVPTVGSPAFSVNALGQLTATSANITGVITATSGSFTGSINSSSGVIGGWNIDTGIIYTGTLGSPNQYLNASGGALFTGTTTCSALGVNSNLVVGGTIVGAGNITASAYLINSGIAIQNGTAVHILSGGRLVQSTSSERFKKNIVNIPEGGWLDKVTQIRPVNFQYDEAYSEAPDEVISGLIAEDIAEIPGFEHLIYNDPLGDPFSLSYERLTVFLVLAIKELKAEIDQLKGA